MPSDTYTHTFHLYLIVSPVRAQAAGLGFVLHIIRNFCTALVASPLGFDACQEQPDSILGLLLAFGACTLAAAICSFCTYCWLSSILRLRLDRGLSPTTIPSRPLQLCVCILLSLVIPPAGASLTHAVG